MNYPVRGWGEAEWEYGYKLSAQLTALASGFDDLILQLLPLSGRAC